MRTELPSHAGRGGLARAAGHTRYISASRSARHRIVGPGRGVGCAASGPAAWNELLGNGLLRPPPSTLRASAIGHTLEVVAALRAIAESPSFKVKPHGLGMLNLGVRVNAQGKGDQHGAKECVFVQSGEGAVGPRDWDYNELQCEDKAACTKTVTTKEAIPVLM